MKKHKHHFWDNLKKTPACTAACSSARAFTIVKRSDEIQARTELITWFSALFNVLVSSGSDLGHSDGRLSKDIAFVRASREREV